MAEAVHSSYCRHLIRHLKVVQVITCKQQLPLQAAQLRPGTARAYIMEPLWIEACFNGQMHASVMLHACRCSTGSTY